MNHARTSRRQLIRLFGIAAAASTLTACSSPAPMLGDPPVVLGTTSPTAVPRIKPSETAPQPTTSAARAKPAATPSEGKAANVTTVTEMAIRGEWPRDDVINKWGSENKITLKFVQYDLTQLDAMTATGDPPDMYRVQAPDVPIYLTKKFIKDLTPYFQQSSKIKLDDLAPANKNYWYSGLTPGTGQIYGMVKDWSPDLSLYVNKRIFNETDVAVPGDDTVLTYQQLGDLAKQVTKRQGKRTLIMGLGGSFQQWFDRVVEVQLNTEGKSLWSDDFGKINLNTPEARDILEFWFKLNQEDVVHNPLDPSSDNARGAFAAGNLAICQYGYWYSGALNSTRTADEAVFLPAPTWGPTREDPPITATGDVIHSQTRVADEVWKVFEWFHSGEPALERAQSGWGVPGLKSLYDRMPVQTAFQKQVHRVLLSELKISDFPVRYSPYVSQSENVADNPFLSAWQGNLASALEGKTTFDQLLDAVETKVNLAIKQKLAPPA